MTITVRDIDTTDPLPGISVKVDGGSTQYTDSNGQVTASAGNTVELVGYATFVFTESGDRELYIESGIA